MTIGKHFTGIELLTCHPYSSLNLHFIPCASLIHFGILQAVIPMKSKMLPGRYRTCWLARHWSGDPSGLCCLPTCRSYSPASGSLVHILTECPDLIDARSRVFNLWASFLQDKPKLFQLVKNNTVTYPQLFPQLLLDCSVLPDVIVATQVHGSSILEDLFYLSRTYCFSISRQDSKLWASGTISDKNIHPK